MIYIVCAVICFVVHHLVYIRCFCLCVYATFWVISERRHSSMSLFGSNRMGFFAVPLPFNWFLSGSVKIKFSGTFWCWMN